MEGGGWKPVQGGGADATPSCVVLPGGSGGGISAGVTMVVPGGEPDLVSSGSVAPQCQQRGSLGLLIAAEQFQHLLGSAM